MPWFPTILLATDLMCHSAVKKGSTRLVSEAGDITYWEHFYYGLAPLSPDFEGPPAWTQSIQDNIDEGVRRVQCRQREQDEREERNRNRWAAAAMA
jgi:hypothetical protein